jgi:rhamnogalacturonyl hydrolase YesR
MQRHSWEQGVAAQAFLELGERDLVVLMAREAVLRQHPDGRLALVGGVNAVTDPAAVGEAVLFATRITGDARLQDAADRMRDYLLHTAPRNAAGTLYHIIDRPQIWVDSMYMAPPFLAAAGCPAEAVRQIEGFRAVLWHAQARLYAHQWDEGMQTWARAAHWGVGNGWAAAGLARVIAALPPEMAAERARLVAYARDLIASCLSHQRPDALYHDVVDDPSTFVEVNLAQMLAYTIYRGMHDGWLDARFRDHADRMRQAAHARVDAYGLVQGVCGAPHFDHPGTAPEGQAFFLLMESAYQRLQGARRR